MLRPEVNKHWLQCMPATKKCASPKPLKLGYPVRVRAASHVAEIESIGIIFSTIDHPDHLAIKILTGAHLIWMN